jgi:hypothetical protein
MDDATVQQASPQHTQQWARGGEQGAYMYAGQQRCRGEALSFQIDCRRRLRRDIRARSTIRESPQAYGCGRRRSPSTAVRIPRKHSTGRYQLSCCCCPASWPAIGKNASVRLQSSPLPQAGNAASQPVAQPFAMRNPVVAPARTLCVSLWAAASSSMHL